MTELTVGLIQMRSGRSIGANTLLALDGIAAAAARGARFIATPEMTTLLERDRDRFRAEMAANDPAHAIAAFSDAALRHGVHLLIGSMAVPVADGKFANRSFLFAPDGRLLATYDKIHLFDVAVDHANQWRESALYSAGTEAVLVETPMANIGLSICYDVRFASLYRTLAQGGAQILCVPSAFTKPTGAAHWHTLLRARAIESASFVIAPAQGGLHEDGRETFGHSLVITPWGEILEEADHDDACQIIATLDLSEVESVRQRIPSLFLERPVQLKRDT